MNNIDTAIIALYFATMLGFVGYAFQGIGKFAAIYINVDPRYSAIAIFVVTTTYVMLGGLYSVVITDAIQTIILSLVGIGDVTDPEKVMPIVRKNYPPVGIRGVVIAGLLAAFMSTFSSTVNS